jgi:hypothetical protein
MYKDPEGLVFIDGIIEIMVLGGSPLSLLVVPPPFIGSDYVRPIGGPATVLILEPCYLE